VTTEIAEKMPDFTSILRAILRESLGPRRKKATPLSILPGQGILLDSCRDFLRSETYQRERKYRKAELDRSLAIALWDARLRAEKRRGLR